MGNKFINQSMKSKYMIRYDQMYNDLEESQFVHDVKCCYLVRIWFFQSVIEYGGEEFAKTAIYANSSIIRRVLCVTGFVNRGNNALTP